MIFWFILILISGGGTSIARQSSQKNNPVYDLDLSSKVHLKWQVDYENDEVIFEVAFLDKNHQDWVGIGFSNNGEPTNADLCVLWSDWKGEIKFEDSHTDENDTLISIDAKQDCLDFQEKLMPNGVLYTYKRAFDTCDEDDYVIEDGTTHLVWAHGQGPLYSLSNLDIGSKNIATFDFLRTRILKVPIEFDFPEDSKSLEIRHVVDLPSDDTTYWCSVHKLPNEFKTKHHAIQYEPIMTPGNEHLLHHMEVFLCVPDDKDANFPIWSGPCGSDEAPEKLNQCKKVLAAWAMGAGPITYPEEAGLEIGGPDFPSLFVMLEVHFNNEKLQSGVKDNSGMKFVVTQNLRSHDSGIMELGLVYTDKMAIPPGQNSFALHGYCLPQCSAVGLPSGGIHIFASQLHTHGTGIEVETRHFRDGQEMPEVNKDPHYSAHFQEIRPLHNIITVLPGDELVTTCRHQTLSKQKATVGGFTFNEEMCVNYIHYFPRTKHLEICKSSVDGDALKEYFDYLSRWDGQSTNAKELNATANYHAIDWTPLRAMGLTEFYNNAPLEMQCQSGSGSQLPGKWTDMDRSEIDLRPSPPSRNCPDENLTNDIFKRSALKRSDSEDKRALGSMKRKKAAQPFNEMKKRFENKRAGTPFNEMKRIVKKQIIKKQERRKKEDEPMQYNYQNELTTEDLMVEMNEKNIDDIDFSKYWSDYDTWGYDKRSLGSMKRKKAGQPFNEMKKKSDTWAYDKRAIGMKRKKAGQPFNEMKKRRRKKNNSQMAMKKGTEFLNKKLF